MAVPAGSNPPHLLLVDDEISSRILVAAVLRKLGYIVTEAESAEQARSLVSNHGPDYFELVISDYWMPGQNGLELLKYITLEDPTLSVVLLTGDGERGILENAIKINGCGFLQKPVSLKTVEKHAREAIAKTRRLRHLRSTELEANTLGENQRRFLQKHLYAEWPDIEFFFTSKSQASGDFVSAIRLNQNEQLLLVSDASGHELSSALQSNYFHGLARGMLKQNASIEEVYAYFNESLRQEWNDEDMIGHSLCAVALRFDNRTQTLTYLNAGAPHPMLCGQDGFAAPLGISESYGPLGWFAESYQSHSLSSSQGYLYTWTDGLSDLAEDMGVDPLALADRLLDKVHEKPSFMARAQDDIAAIRVKTKPDASDVGLMLPLISLTVSGDRVSQIDEIQAYCEKSLRIAIPKIDCGFLSDLLVCLREALINALKHGCEACPDLSADLRLSRSHDGSKISIQIADEGTGHNFDWQSHAETAAENLIPEHRGLIMMQSIPNRIDFFDRGTRVLMEFEWEPSLN